MKTKKRLKTQRTILSSFCCSVMMSAQRQKAAIRFLKEQFCFYFRNVTTYRMHISGTLVEHVQPLPRDPDLSCIEKTLESCKTAQSHSRPIRSEFQVLSQPLASQPDKQGAQGLMYMHRKAPHISVRPLSPRPV